MIQNSRCLFEHQKFIGFSLQNEKGSRRFICQRKRFLFSAINVGQMEVKLQGKEGKLFPFSLLLPTQKLIYRHTHKHKNSLSHTHTHVVAYTIRIHLSKIHIYTISLSFSFFFLSHPFHFKNANPSSYSTFWMRWPLAFRLFRLAE